MSRQFVINGDRETKETEELIPATCSISLHLKFCSLRDRDGNKSISDNCLLDSFIALPWLGEISGGA